MPTYEYACKDCGHTFEVVRSMHDEPLTICPNCGGSLRKVFAPPAIAFKGSGFYATDHGKKKTKAPAAEGGGKQREGGKPEGGKQGKPATGGDGAGKSGSSTAKEGSSSGGATESGAS